MFEIIVLGFGIVMFVLVAVSTTARVAEATANVHSVARDGALWVSRHGGDPPQTEGIVVSVRRGATSVEVTASTRVVLVGAGGRTMSTTVKSTVLVPISAYRSAP